MDQDLRDSMLTAGISFAGLALYGMARDGWAVANGVNADTIASALMAGAGEYAGDKLGNQIFSAGGDPVRYLRTGLAGGVPAGYAYYTGKTPLEAAMVGGVCAAGHVGSQYVNYGAFNL